MKIDIKKYILRMKNDFQCLSNITRFRLINLTIVIIIFGFITPILDSFKGIYMGFGDIHASTVISFFWILGSVVGLLNDKILEKLNLSQMFLGAIIFHFLITLIIPIYFWNPTIMIYLESLMGIFDGLLFTAYSIALGNYITYFENEKFQIFQNLRIKIMLISGIVSYTLSFLVTLVFSNDVALIIFCVVNFFFFLYLFKNKDIYKNDDFKYKVRYFLNLKRAERKF